MRHTSLAAAGLAFCLAAAPSAGQTPSAEEIIAGLKPGAQQLNSATRGIRRMPAPDAHAAAAAPDDAPAVSLTVDFATGSAEITPAAGRTLAQLGRALSSPALAGFRFRVEGHTDTVGTAEANKTLSQRRAEAVAAYLESRFAIAAARLEPVGLGSAQLLVQTPDQTAEAGNRRVRVVNLGS